MAIIHHYTRKQGSEFDISERLEFNSPAEFVISEIPDGVPFRCYLGEACTANDITDNVSAMLKDGEFTVIESPGGGTLKFLADPFGIVSSILNLFIDQPSAIAEPNKQAQSANNSLTNRNNEARPYLRVFDICGTVQCVPSDLMQSYNIYDESGKEYQYGYYYIGRGFLDTPESGITDGDTLLSNISGSGAAIYDPFTSPNNSAPRQVVGAAISEDLYITARSGEIEGGTLLAPNELTAKVSAGSIASLSGTAGTINDPTGDAAFDDFFSAGDSVRLVDIRCPTGAVLDGVYTVTLVSGLLITVDATPSLAQWQKIAGGSAAIDTNENAQVQPEDINTAGFSDWFTISKISPERILANFLCQQGLYKDNGEGPKRTSVTVQLQYQLLDENLVEYGPIYSVAKTLTDKSRDSVGMSIYANIGTLSAVRVRARRSSNKDLEFEGNVADEIKFTTLYGQIKDSTPHYGDITTVHTIRKQTAQATSIKKPQLKILSTEMLFKYLGGGVFDTVRTPNTQAVQTLIRIMRDPLIGDVSLTAENMDELISVQQEIEAYFGSELAGQFSYTLDDDKLTAQDTAQLIAKAIFCSIGRPNNKVTLDFERPQVGPDMVFTHRSKIGDDKWQRSFKGQGRYDSVELSYIDPKTNIKETIKIPDTGGIKPNKIDAKGVRNYQQAFWLANRARQKDLLGKISVSFTATEEGIYVRKGRAISVVDGSRVASFDGYVVAQNGLTLTLSQEVEFTAGDDHSIILKRRNGTAESVGVIESPINKRTVVMLSTPIEPIYTGNSAVKTEFSFGNEARHLAQLIIPATIDPSGDKSVKITGFNYDARYYLFDKTAPISGAYSDGYSDGYTN